MCIVDTIRQLANKKGMSLTTLEQAVGLGNGTIGKWKKQSPSCDKIKLVADFLSVDINYLVYGKERSSFSELTENERELLLYYKELPDREQIKIIGKVSILAEQAKEKAQQAITMTTNINVYEIAAGAGVSVPFSEDDNYTVRIFPQTDVPSNADCGIYINGKSMEPKFPDGCIVWVDRKREANYGDPVIAIYDGAPYCKIYQPDGLHSINPDYKTIKICEDDNCKIFGKVIGFYVE